jgi:SAM-dependent methyltransferase
MSSVSDRPSETPAAEEQPPPTTMLFGMWAATLLPKMIHTVVKHRIPDLLIDGPRPSGELALVCRLDSQALQRVMRTMASLGFFHEDPRGTFALASLGEVLRSDDTTGGHALAELFWWADAAVDELPHAVETGRSGMELAYGMPFFDFLDGRPEHSRNFDRAVTGAYAGEKEAVASTYDFAGATSVVDVGGGHGTLLRLILERHPHLHGLLFDRPAAIEAGGPDLGAVRDRCELVRGDFFESVPGDHDVLVLSHVIHDWDDERSSDILRNCLRALAPGGRVLLVEMVVPPGDVPHPAKMLDMVMLAITGGMERTEDEYAELLDRAGLRLARVLPTPAPVSIVEAVAADD